MVNNGGKGVLFGQAALPMQIYVFILKWTNYILGI